MALPLQPAQLVVDLLHLGLVDFVFEVSLCMELLHHHQLGVQICNVPADLPCGRVFLLSLQLGGFQTEQSLTQDVVFREPKLIDHGDEGIVDPLLAVVV